MSLLAVVLGFAVSFTAFGVETTGEKFENKVDEIKKDAKINTRKAKRKARNVHCTDAARAEGKCGLGMDAKDTASNVGDEVSHESKKLKNKID